MAAAVSRPDRDASRPRVATGGFAAVRLYDVAYDIDLARVEALAPSPEIRSPARVRLRRAEPKAMTFGEPPVEIALGSVPIRVDADERMVEVVARVHDFGVITIRLHLVVTDMGWDDYVTLGTALDHALNTESAAPVWAEQLGRVRALIAPALGRPSPAGLEEDYFIASVHRFDRPMTAAELTASVDLVPVLTGERRTLSETARADLLRQSFSYYEDDLAVITWDHAFVYEPGDDTDVADVLEVANAQLLEFRYYDAVLDAELPRMYQNVRQTQSGLAALARGRHARLARQLQTRVAEVTELTERVDNALIVTEDVYLARVYGAALDLFRVRVWAAAVDRKLSIMRDTYTALYDEAASTRAELLEAAIVLLIVIDILIYFVF